MCKRLILLFVIINTCQVIANNQNLSRKSPIKHHYGLHHHGLIHYFAFLAIKAKIIFIIGTFISFWLFAGKAFAFLYYISQKEKCNCHDFHGKYIFGNAPEFEHKFSHPGPPPDFLEKKLFYNQPHFQQRYSTIKNPNKQTFESPQNSYQKFSRSMKNSIFGNVDLFRSVINKADLTEWAFEAMNMKESECKKRFVCETDQTAKDNALLAFSMHIFSDTGLMKYRTNSTTLEDCKSLGPQCNDI